MNRHTRAQAHSLIFVRHPVPMVSPTHKRCVQTPIPKITGLADLEAVLHLGVNPNAGNGKGGNPGIVLMGHSESVVAKSVSSINPRAILFPANLTSATPSTPYNVLSFTRGDQFAEIATFDPVAQQVNFYIVTFQKACNLTNSCTPADLLTPEGEKDWINVNAYEDDGHTVPSLPENTIMDCQRCHETQGPSVTPILRMQEITAPYTHFFSPNTHGGRALLDDYFSAHDISESYAGIPGKLIAKSNPALFAQFITTAGFGNQPNSFPSAVIEKEVKQSDPQQPFNDQRSGKSATWETVFTPFVDGMFNPPPYHDVKITNPEKLAALSRDYREVMHGRKPASSLPDIRDDMKTGAKFLAEMSFIVNPSNNPQSLLVNACMNCHNSNLVQTISRARFNVQTLSQMTPAELTVAIDRIQEPADNLLLMPPAPFRAFTDEQKQIVVAYLASLAGIQVPPPPAATVATPVVTPTPAAPSLAGLAYTCSANIFADDMTIQLIQQPDGTYYGNLIDLSVASNDNLFTGVTLTTNTAGIQDYNVSVPVPLLYNSNPTVTLDFMIDPSTNLATLNINQPSATGGASTAFLSQSGIACTPNPGFTPVTPTTPAPAPTPTPTVVATSMPTSTPTSTPTPTPTATAATATFTAVNTQILQTSCVSCHNSTDAAGVFRIPTMPRR